MPLLIGGKAAAMAAVSTRVPRARQRLPLLDHLIRTYQRYQADTGDQLAAAVTFYWFLSLFPILLLAISLMGYVYGADAPSRVTSALGGYLPDPLVTTIGTTLESAKGKAGILGLIGLLLSGLGWIDALRQAIRSIWHHNAQVGNIVVRKLADVVILLGLFATVGGSIVVTGATTATSGAVLDLLGVADTGPARLFTSTLAYLLAGIADTALFVFLFTRLARVRSPLRQVLRGAVFGAVGFALIKWAGAFYVTRTTSKGEATYGAFAVVVGLLVFLNLVSRFLLFTAAFTVTAPYDSDVAPSATANPEQARQAGIPTGYADNDPDQPLVLQADGTPTQLRHAVPGRASPQDEPSGPPGSQEQTGQGNTVTSSKPGTGSTAGNRAAAMPAGPAAVPSGSAAAKVQMAAHVTAGAIGAVLIGVGVHAVRTGSRLLRR